MSGNISFYYLAKKQPDCSCGIMKGILHNSKAVFFIKKSRSEKYMIFTPCFSFLVFMEIIYFFGKIRFTLYIGNIG